MQNYLSRRNGGAYLYQRRVPRDLRHRRDVFKNQFIEEYLGTTDRATAKRKVSAINEQWERTFDAMRRDEAITAEQLERIRLAAQFQVHGAMMADPLDGPNEVADALAVCRTFRSFRLESRYEQVCRLRAGPGVSASARSSGLDPGG
jgi:hypothetical protein